MIRKRNIFYAKRSFLLFQRNNSCLFIKPEKIADIVYEYVDFLNSTGI